MDSTVSPKMKTTEGEGVEAHSLAHNTLGVEKCVGASGWGLGRLISKSIIRMDVHKPNKFINAQLEHLWCIDKSQANMDSQDSPWLRLGGSHHLPPYNILCVWPHGQHPNVILS